MGRCGRFLPVNYNFRERYLLEVNGRYDGSSKFPTDEQWAFFSVGVSRMACIRRTILESEPENSFQREDPRFLRFVR
jgi:hypothetical protein